MPVILVAVAAVIVAATAVVVATAQRRARPASGGAPAPSLTQTQTEAAAIIDRARTEALADRVAVDEEIAARQAALEADEAALAERERTWRDRRAVFDERRFAHRQRREEIEARAAGIAEERARGRLLLEERAVQDREGARRLVLEGLDQELAAEHPGRVADAAAEVADDPAPAARVLLLGAMERQTASHVDSAPRLIPLPLDGLDEVRRERVLTALQVVAESTSTDLGIDDERQQATLRGLDPVGREIARQASIEVLDRNVQAAGVPPLILRTRRDLGKKITELGERALWEMSMEGRPELADLMGVLHYRFSYGQNALLHCQETGHLCSLLAAELGLPQALARQAGALHDIGKAVDHDVEGSHALIGGEILRILGADLGVVHAVKAHHFDEEPSTDLAMLTICADAISASRPGARRDTLTAYLARLEQLQTIATRHAEVERAYPLQAGREVRVFVRARKVADDEVPALTGEIAREIEAEMQYPGVIKVMVIRETQATATAPVQVGRPAEPADPTTVGLTTKRRRRRRKPAPAESPSAPAGGADR
jgi:ribonuclease Y